MAERLAITTEYITLQQLLKIENIIPSGGQAKAYLAEAEVYLNGEPENRRGKKLYPGDQIKTAGQVFEIAEESDEEMKERAEKAAILARFQQNKKPAKKTGQTKKKSGQKKTSKNRPTGPASWS
ncbi:S4 domain-containing protein YaaA [Fructobacillus parabroussonetiae]|uniref:S4 domain-containing protein YaaA n=1 Tax=Fructobacillus parabroussonetiae TaxID=2713174 RepID=A0ABS5QUJ1_9LACO|nr:S4 domain-containing protein YaaA [Fructobacillus parabroussonetiae]MBS9336861.1 S4 domain-containing protein YaaA [Fructobacillus parabroussonetiae]MCK8617531.1 S4 domain-containing protein YaaA [Fructobacillus parabroussonetiae]